MTQRKNILLALIPLMGALLACNALTQLAPSGGIPTENPYLEIPRVTLEEAKAGYDSSEAVFVDVRSESQYNLGHIAGALWVPLSDIVEGRTGALSQDDWIITYCT